VSDAPETSAPEAKHSVYVSEVSPAARSKDEISQLLKTLGKTLESTTAKLEVSQNAERKDMSKHLDESRRDLQRMEEAVAKMTKQASEAFLSLAESQTKLLSESRRELQRMEEGVVSKASEAFVKLDTAARESLQRALAQGEASLRELSKKSAANTSDDIVPGRKTDGDWTLRPIECVLVLIGALVCALLLSARRPGPDASSLDDSIDELRRLIGVLTPNAQDVVSSKIEFEDQAASQLTNTAVQLRILGLHIEKIETLLIGAAAGGPIAISHQVQHQEMQIPESLTNTLQALVVRLDEVDKLREERAVLELDLRDKEHEVIALSERMDNLKECDEARVSMVKDLKRHVDKHEPELENFKDLLRAKASENAALANAVSQLTGQIAHMQQQQQGVENSHLVQLFDGVSALTERLEEMQRQLDYSFSSLSASQVGSEMDSLQQQQQQQGARFSGGASRQQHGASSPRGSILQLHNEARAGVHVRSKVEQLNQSNQPR